MAVLIKFWLKSNSFDESTDTLNIAHLRTFIRFVFTNIDILEQFLGLVPMQSTETGKDKSKEKVQCTIIKFLKVQYFASITSIKTK